MLVLEFEIHVTYSYLTSSTLAVFFFQSGRMLKGRRHLTNANVLKKVDLVIWSNTPPGKIDGATPMYWFIMVPY